MRKINYLIFLIIIILIIFILIFMYNQINISNTKSDIHTVLEHQIENTYFSIDNKEYYLELEDIQYKDLKNDISSSLTYNVAVNYSIYDNENYIGEEYIIVSLKRNSINEKYYIDNQGYRQNKNSIVSKLYLSFVDFYYKNIINGSNNGKSYSIDEKDLVYDNKDRLIDSGIVHYYIEYEDLYGKVQFKSDFTLNLNEELIIPINIITTFE